MTSRKQVQSKKSHPAEDPRSPSLRVMTLPRDTNNLGTIFGGVIMSYIDQAGYIEARKHGRFRWVTVAMDKVIFHAPVYVGDIVNLYTRTTRIGRTSISVFVEVIVERFETRDLVNVTEAELTFVAVDEQGRPIEHGNTARIV